MSSTFENQSPGLGQDYLGPKAVVPKNILQVAKLQPVPISISGANQVTFAIPATPTNKFVYWLGNDVKSLSTTVSYTWTNASNTILDSDGAEASLTGSTLGMWYFYLSPDGSFLPSQTKPNWGGNSPHDVGPRSHPGKSKTKPWLCVGFQLCTTAATPVFKAMTKIGYDYIFAKIDEVTTGTSMAEIAFATDTALPNLSHLGVKVSGYITPDAVGDPVTIGTTATLGLRVYTSVSDEMSAFLLNSSGKLYAKHGTAAGTISVTSITDTI